MGDLEAETLLAACKRCGESFELSQKRLVDLRKGIEDTAPFIAADYKAVGLFVPREEEVRVLMQAKLIMRLEVLAKGYRDSVTQLGNQVTLFAGKLEALEALAKQRWEVLSELEGLRRSLATARAEQEKCQRFLASLRYFEH
jgi:hypothetical protein